MGHTSIFPVSSNTIQKRQGYKLDMSGVATGLSIDQMSIDQILKTYDLPHRLLAYFSSQCAKDALSRIKDPDARSTLAVDVAERFGNGEDFSQEYLEKVQDDAYSAYSALAASATATATASYAALAATYAALSAASYAALAATSYPLPTPPPAPPIPTLINLYS